MNFQPGRMGTAEGIGLIFIITFAKIFLSTPARSAEISAGLSWLAVLVAAVAAFVPVLLLNFVFKWIPGDLYSITRKLFGRWGAGFIALFYIGIFMSDAALLLRQFAENTLLTALPNAEFSLVIIIYGLVVGVLLYLGIEAIARSSYLLMPFIITSMLLIFLMLSPLYNLYNLAPWLGNGIGTTVQAGMLTAGINIGAIVAVVMATSFQDYRNLNACLIFGLGSSALIKSIFFVIYVMVFGVAIAQEKTLPFFETARLVYLSRYLQRIEAIFILLWVIVGIISIAISVYMALYLISRLLKLPTMAPLIPVVMLILIELAMIPEDITTAINLDYELLSTYYNGGLYVFPVLLFVMAYVKKRKLSRQAAT
jgi:spore germination protein KB